MPKTLIIPHAEIATDTMASHLRLANKWIADPTSEATALIIKIGDDSSHTAVLPHNHAQLSEKLATETKDKTVTGQNLVDYALADAQLCHDILSTDTYQDILSAENILDIIYFYGSSAVASLSAANHRKLKEHATKICESTDDLGHHGYAYADKFIPCYDPDDVFEHALKTLPSSSESPRTVALWLYVITGIIADKSQDDKQVALEKLVINDKLGTGYHFTCYELRRGLKEGMSKDTHEFLQAAYQSYHPAAVANMLLELSREVKKVQEVEKKANLDNNTKKSISTRKTNISSQYMTIIHLLANEHDHNPSLNPALAIAIINRSIELCGTPISELNVSLIQTTLNQLFSQFSHDAAQSNHSQLAPAAYAFAAYQAYIKLYDNADKVTHQDANKVSYYEQALARLADAIQLGDVSRFQILLKRYNKAPKSVTIPEHVFDVLAANDSAENRVKWIEEKTKCYPSDQNKASLQAVRAQHITTAALYQQVAKGQMSAFRKLRQELKVSEKEIFSNVLAELYRLLDTKDKGDKYDELADIRFNGHLDLLQACKEHISKAAIGEFLFLSAKLGSQENEVREFNTLTWKQLCKELWVICDALRCRATDGTPTKEVLTKLCRAIVQISEKSISNADKKARLFEFIKRAYFDTRIADPKREFPTINDGTKVRDLTLEEKLVERLGDFLESHYYAFSHPGVLHEVDKQNPIEKRFEEQVIKDRNEEALNNLKEYLAHTREAATKTDKALFKQSMASSLIGANINIHMAFDPLNKLIFDREEDFKSSGAREVTARFAAESQALKQLLAVVNKKSIADMKTLIKSVVSAQRTQEQQKILEDNDFDTNYQPGESAKPILLAILPKLIDPKASLHSQAPSKRGRPADMQGAEDADIDIMGAGDGVGAPSQTGGAKRMRMAQPR